MFRLTSEILKFMSMDEDVHEFLLVALRKIEGRMNSLIEERNHLVKNFKNLHLDRRYPRDIVSYEDATRTALKEERMTKKKEEERIKAEEVKQAKKKADEERMNQEIFRGHPLAPRSKKAAFKLEVVEMKDPDEQTTNERLYLDPELFLKLQNAKQLKAEQTRKAALLEASRASGNQ